MSDPTKGRPRFMPALRLRCLYCAKEPLLKPGSWFEFRPGCPNCGYRFEREVGYFTGASWMINFPVTSALAFILAWVMVVYLPGANGLLIAALISLVMIGFGIGFFPFANALWMYFEHFLHPLSEEDAFEGDDANFQRR